MWIFILNFIFLKYLFLSSHLWSVTDRRAHQTAWAHQIFLKNWNLDWIYLEGSGLNSLQQYGMGAGGFVDLPTGGTKHWQITTDCLFVSLAFFKTLQKWNRLRKPLETLGSLQRRDIFSGNSPPLSCSRELSVWFSFLDISAHSDSLPFSLFVQFLPIFTVFHGEGTEGRKGFSSHQIMSHHYIDRQKGRQKDWANTFAQLPAKGSQPSRYSGIPHTISLQRWRGCVGGCSLWGPSWQQGESSPWGACYNQFLGDWMVNIL